MNRTDKMSHEEAERLVRETAIREGACLPKTAGELEIVKKTVPAEEGEIPDFREVLARIRGDQPAPGKVVALPVADDSQVVEELAMAARNGGAIPEEVRLRMDADRKQAEQPEE